MDHCGGTSIFWKTCVVCKYKLYSRKFNRAICVPENLSENDSHKTLITNTLEIRTYLIFNSYLRNYYNCVKQSLHNICNMYYSLPINNLVWHKKATIIGCEMYYEIR